MKKFLKYTIISIVSVIIFCIVGLTLVVTLVNPNRFKPLIEKAVYQSTGRTLTLGGDISWKIYPNLGVNLKQVSLSNPTGFNTKNFVTIDSADVSVALLPLLTHRIIIKTLAIDGLNLALIKQHGQNNWTFTPPEPEQETSKIKGEKEQKLQLELSNFSFTKATISYDDFDSQKHYALNNIKLILDTGFNGKVQFDQSLELVNLKKVNLNYNDQVLAKLNFKAQNFKNPVFTGDIEITKLLANQLMQQFKLSNAKKLNLLDNLSFAGHIDGDKNNITIEDFNFNLSNKLKGKTNLKVVNLNNPSYKGKLSLDPFNLNQILDSLDITVNARKNKPLLNSVTVSTDGFSGDKNNINLNNLQVNLSDKLRLIFAKLNIENFSNPAINGKINIPNFNLSNVLDNLGMAEIAAHKPLLNSFALNTQFQATSSSAKLNNTNFSFGNTLHGNANLTVNNFTKPKFNGDFNLPTFSLNQVISQLGESVPKLANTKWLSSFAISSIISGTDNSLNLQGLKIRASNTNLTGNLNISSIKPLSVNENILIDSLDAADLTDLNGFKVPMRQIQLIGNSSFTGSNLLRNLNGKQNIKIANITAKGFSLDKLILDLDKTLNKAGQGNDNVTKILANATEVLNTINSMKQKVSTVTKPGNKDYSKTTNLGSLSVNTTINHGIINPSNFKLSGPSAEVVGNGSINLVTHALNYHASSKLLVNGINPAFKHLAFPINIAGTTSKPSGSLDWASIEQQLLRYAVTQNKAQIQNAVKQGINQAVGEQIKKSIGDQGGNKAINEVSKGITNAIGNMFGGGDKNKK
ncbi:MAG: AsmA family protein [Neisseriaceae bacterium]